MPHSSVPIGFKHSLLPELTAMRKSGDYDGAFTCIDREVSKVFVDNKMPERPSDLLMLAVLSGRKASMMREIAGGEMVDALGNHAGWAVSPEQSQEVIVQILGWYQLSLASSGRLLGALGEQDIADSRSILASELSALRRDFLDWEEKPGPAGMPLPQLPAQLAQVLFSQLWSLGDFAGAEDLLFLVRDLLSTEGNDPGTIDVARQFYNQLLTLSDDKLEQGGLPREEIIAAMAEFGLEG